MDAETKKILEEEVLDCISKAKTYEPGSAEYIACTDRSVKLGKLLTEIEQAESEIASRSDETSSKRKQSSTANLLHVLDLLTSIAGTVLCVGTYTRCYHQGLEFEKTGTVCSGTVKNHIRLFNFMKK